MASTFVCLLEVLVLRMASPRWCALAIALCSAAALHVHGPIRPRATSRAPVLAAVETSPQWSLTPPSADDGDYEVLRGRYDRDKLVSFFSRRPIALINRGLTFARVYRKVKALWDAEEALAPGERTRGEVLRSELSRLGPVSVKLGQTLSQRPDLVGEDVCAALKSLQTSNEPFADADAWSVLRAELRVGDRPLAPGAAFALGTTR